MTPFTLPVSEVFGPTWQGEGRYAGQLCGFLRLGLCNLSCEWCDTPYTWDRSRYDVKAECPDAEPAELAARIIRLNVELMVLSGGEPLIHALRDDRCPLAMVVRTVGARWVVETNGTLIPPRWMSRAVEHFTVSPKIATVSDPVRRRLKPDALRWWAGAAAAHRADFKFVVQDVADLTNVDDLVETYGVPHDRVWVMPEGTATAELLDGHRAIADAVLARRYHTTTRLQTLLWGEARGH